MDSLKLVLLNKSEIKYLLNSKVLSKSFEYKIKSQLKKKISLFLENELPLLLESGLIGFNDLQIYISNNNMLLNLGKEQDNFLIFVLIIQQKSEFKICK